MSTLRETEQRDEYVHFCESIRDLTQIDLLQYKRGQMERRIRSFAQRRGLSGLGEYLALLRSRREELDAFLDRVTINVSQLWRNPEQWRLLRDTIVPELAATGRLRVWSAGCSYGAEAYTCAAVALETAPKARVSVLGTDIDRRMIDRARAGVFSAEDARTAPPATLERWFERDGDGWRAKRELLSVVRFETGDLLRDRFPREAYDLVFCRNVVIYFTEDVRDELHRRLAEAVRPGGYLMVGSTERITAPTSIGLAASHPFTYRKA
jgi:chemotaxis protein methyltransferase CheR